MGQNDRAGANAKPRVRSLRNLRVVDTSIMPSITSGKTNASTMILAYESVELILSRRF